MNKLETIGLLAIVVFGIAAIASSASAYRGDPTIEGPYHTDEREALMEQAFDTLDYEAWYALMTEDGRHPKVVDVVDEDNFETFVNAHDAARNGDSETASALRAELGLGLGQRQGQGKMQGQGNHQFGGFMGGR